jgi:PIN domain nuclease of toxin-antitoxin system
VGRGSLIVADTHVWIWWMTNRSKLSGPALEALATAGPVTVSVISHWEIATLVRRGRLTLDRDPLRWIEEASTRGPITTRAITPAIAVRAGSFGDEVVGDPADRLIIATALAAGVPLVTKDERIRSAGVVETIW